MAGALPGQALQPKTPGFLARLEKNVGSWLSRTFAPEEAELQKDDPEIKAALGDVSHDATKVEAVVAAHGDQVGKVLEVAGQVAVDVGTVAATLAQAKHELAAILDNEGVRP